MALRNLAVQLYKTSFAGWNVAHFHGKYTRESLAIDVAGSIC